MIMRRPFKKWLLISMLCGAHSFFWGVIAQGNLLAMMLGIITLAAGFAAIESHRCYQMKREASPMLARALDAGVKLRCWLAVAVFCSVIVQLNQSNLSALAKKIINAPFAAELWIGAQSMQMTKNFTGLTFESWQPGRRERDESKVISKKRPTSGIEHFLATYITTLITGLAHTIILGVICVLTYFVLCVREKIRSDIDDNNIAAP